MLLERLSCFYLTRPNKVILVWKSRNTNGCLEGTCRENNCHGDEFMYRKRGALQPMSSPPSLSVCIVNTNHTFQFGNSHFIFVS